MTKTAALALARRARRFGHFEHGNGVVSVRCPKCREVQQTSRNYRFRPARNGEPGTTDPNVNGGKRSVYERETSVQALDRAVADHLVTECTPECTCPVNRSLQEVHSPECAAA